MPDEDADGRMTDEEIEAELQAALDEVRSSAFRSATCNVSVYSTDDGAVDAFQGELEDLRVPSHLAHVEAINIQPIDGLEDTVLVTHEYSAPQLTKFLVLLRRDNVVGEISVSSNCGGELGQDCGLVRERAHSLAALLDQRIADAGRGVDLDEPTKQDTVVAQSVQDNARANCGPRNFSECVEQYVEHAEAGEPVALCRSQYGGWFFEAPEGDVGDFCSNDDYVIAAVIDTQP